MSRKSAGLGFMQLLMVLAATLVAALFLIAPPRVRTVDPRVSSASEASDMAGGGDAESGVGADDSALESASSSATPITSLSGVTSPMPAARTTAAVNVHVGPSLNYAVIGLLPGGARPEIVGRDATGKWLAVVFSPGSKLTGWIETAKVLGLTDVMALEVAPETPLQVEPPSQRQSPKPAPTPQPTRTPVRRP